MRNKAQYEVRVDFARAEWVVIIDSGQETLSMRFEPFEGRLFVAGTDLRWPTRIPQETKIWPRTGPRSMTRRSSMSFGSASPQTGEPSPSLLPPVLLAAQ